MLIEFKVSNFRSIREQQTFSLVASNADKDLPECVIERNLPGLSKLKYLKGAALYGANASGKSNVLDAIRFLKKFVETSVTEIKPGELIATTPFKLDSESASKPSTFEITFVAANVRYQFGLSVTPTRVIEEFLVAYPKGLAQRWYHRTYNEEKQIYEWAKPASTFKHDKDLQEKTRENSLFLSVGPQFNHPQLTPVFNWFTKNLRFLNPGKTNSLYTPLTAEMLSEFSDSYREFFVSLLKNADIGVVDVFVEKGEIDYERVKNLLNIDNMSQDKLVEIGETLSETSFFRKMKVRFAHQVGNETPVLFDIEEESEGTRRYFELMGPWWFFLASDNTVFIDEIETSLHPLLAKALIQLVVDNRVNSDGAQVVFTTHSPLLLDCGLLRRDQIWFTEKTPAGTTHLYPLTDYSPRKDEALAKGYLAGRYGAIPYIPEGLLR
ncbi:MAG TPA: AAA family ATPase [Candidatus Sumerlaeota bacterium]|mgnify:CR=1 FL=1|nr:AAA family ATPase [Candidatus Sumerlaeota bacterium]